MPDRRIDVFATPIVSCGAPTIRCAGCSTIVGNVPNLTALEAGMVAHLHGALPQCILVVWLGSWPMKEMGAMTLKSPSSEGSA